jgi:predicted transcriptional regulator
MNDTLCLLLIALGCVLAYQFVLRPIAFISDILEAIGDSAKDYQEIRELTHADEESLSWALNFMENCLKLVQRPRGKTGGYQLTDIGRHELRRMQH